MQSIICSNFGIKRGAFTSCRGCWCPDCYDKHPLDDYQIRLPKDEDPELVREEDEGRFSVARRGDHLLVPFQCDLCQFRNVWNRNPTEKDAFKLMLVRRAILDGFWSREEDTVKKVWSDTKRLLSYQEEHELSVVNDRGPFALGDDTGLSYGLALLLRARDPGKPTEDGEPRTISYETLRKQSTTINHLIASEPYGHEPVHGILKSTIICHSKAKNYGRLFDSINKGISRRLGHNPKQDLGISIDVILYIMAGYKRRYVQCPESMKYEDIAMAFIFIITFCTGRRGFEMFFLNLTKLNEIVQTELSISRK